MSERLKSLRRALVVVLVSTVTLVLALVGALHLDVTLSIVRDTVVDVVNESLQGELSIGAVSGSPFGELRLSDVTLKTPDGEEIVSIDELRAATSLAQLIGRGVEVEITASGTRVFLKRSSGGELNLVEALPAPTDEESSGLPVWLDLRIQLPDASVVWRDDGAEPGDADPLTAITATTTATKRRELAQKLTMPPSPPRAAPHTVLLDGLATSVRVVVSKNQETSVQVGEASFEVASASITPLRKVEIGKVALDLPSDGSTYVNVKALDVEDWLQLAEARLVLPPELADLSVRVEGLHATESALGFAVPEAGLRTSLTADVALVPDERTSRFTMRLTPDEGEPIVATGTIADWVEAGPQTTWSASILVPVIEATKLSAMAHPLQRFGAAVSVDGQGVAPDQLRASARVALHSVDVDRYRVQSAFVAATFADQRLTVDRAFVQTPYASAATGLEFGVDGTFALTVRAEATDEVAELAAKLFKRQVDTRADITLTAEGQLDLQAAEPMEMMQRLDAEAKWDINEFVAEDVRVKRSTGDVRAQVDVIDGVAQLDVRGRVSGQSIRSAGTSLGSMSADVRATSRANTDSPDPMAILKGLTSRIDLDVNGLISEGSLVRDVDLLLDVSPSGNRLRWNLRGSAAKIAAGDVRVADTAARLRGAVTLGEQLTWPAAVRAIEVKGDVSARGVNAAGDAVNTINARLDVRGPLQSLKGSVSASTTGLNVADYAFTDLAAKVSFVGDRVFEIDANGKQKERKPSDLGVFVRGRYNRDLTDYQILELRFRSAGDSWNLSEGFSFDANGGNLRFDDVTLARGDQRINIQGTFRQGKDQDLAVDIDQVELATIAEDLGLTALAPLRGRVSAEAELAGTSAEPTARFSVHLQDIYWEEYGPFELVAEGRYGTRELVVESFEVDGYGARLVEGNAKLPVALDMSGAFEVLQSEPMELFLQTPKLDPERFHEAIPPLANWRARGEVSLKTNLRGTLRSPRLNVDVRAEDLRFSPLWDDDERLDVGPIAATFGARYTSPKTDNGGFEISLNARWADEPPVQLLARIEADVAAWLRESLDGAEIDWMERVQKSSWRFIGQAQKFDLRNVRIGPLREADVEGELTLNIIGDGTFAEPRANFEIRLADFGWNRYRDVYFDADLAVQSDGLELKRSRLEWDADEILTADGKIPVPFKTLFGDAPLGRMPIDFRIKLQPVKLAKLSAVDYSFAALTGTASGFVSLGGTLKKPIIETRLAAEEIQFSDRSTGGVALDASLMADGQANARLQWNRDGKPTLEANGSLPIDLNIVRLAEGKELELSGPFSAKIDSDDVPLAGLLPRRIFDRWVRDVGGQLNASMQVGGTVVKPTFDGRISVQAAELTLSESERSFSEIELDVSGQPSGLLTLHDLHVKGEQGHVSADGTLQHDGWQPGAIDGDVEVREFGTTGFTDLAIFVTADARLGGNFAAKPATATATVDNVEVVMPDSSDQNAHPTSLDKDIVVIRSEKDRQKLYAVAGTLEPVSTSPFLELGIIIERGARVRHPMAQVELEGDLDLRFSEAGPLLYGEINAYRGRAKVLDKEFEIQQGLVTFTGSDPPDPRLQLEAAYFLDERITNELGQASTGEPRAIVRVTGRATDPRIRFRSDPAMPESDIVYVLMTGRLPGQGGVGEGVAYGAATGLLTNLIAESPVGRVVDVKVEAGDEGLSDASIEVGRYIGRDVFISLDLKNSAEADENTSELHIEYRFLPRWILDVGAGNRATGEVTILWDLY